MRKTVFNTNERCKAERTRPDRLHRHQKLLPAMFVKATSADVDTTARGCCCSNANESAKESSDEAVETAESVAESMAESPPNGALGTVMKEFMHT